MIDKVFNFLFSLAAASISAAISGALAIVIAASLRGAAPTVAAAFCKILLRQSQAPTRQPTATKPAIATLRRNSRAATSPAATGNHPV